MDTSLKKLFKSTVETPIGEMILITSEKGLCFLEYSIIKRNKLIENRIKKYYSQYEIINEENSIKKQLIKQLHLYFSNKKTNFSLIPMDVKGTDFEKKVWNILAKIPYGKVFTYKEVAIKLGNTNASRAVGGASRRNPVSIIVPCHRVIGTTGSLTGYGGGLSKKSWLIKHESID